MQWMVFAHCITFAPFSEF
uniref:Uncharacterized protein n=1 Tax=Rhizophora mucronata TaxID=61149 RepID=A0A2P2JD51_RHIMU